MPKLRSSREHRQQLSIENRYLEQPTEGMQLVSSLISMPEQKEEIAKLLEQLNKMIHYDFLTICNMEATPNEAELFAQLEKVFDDLGDLTEFSALANKNIVAVGGGFSAGKSHFLNSILKDDLLPTDTTPTTAIPTYIARGEEERISAINSFNLKVPIDREAVKAISHAFAQKYNVSFSHIIKVLTAENLAMPYENIAFLDTPGYSKSDSLVKGDNTDERIAKEQLANADYVIWLVDTVKGTIPETDIQFLRELRFAKPIFVVFNKADLRPWGEVENILETAKERLQHAGIRYEAVVAYNSAAREQNEYKGNQLEQFLQGINSKIKFTTVKKQFQRVFQQFITYNHHQYRDQRKQLELFNELYLYSDQLSTEHRATIKEQVEAMRRMVQDQKHVIQLFEALEARMNSTIDIILEHVSVHDGEEEDEGIPGTLTVKHDTELDKLEEGMQLSFRVAKINPFGIFLDGGFSDQVMISVPDVEQRLSNPMKEVFHTDMTVTGTVQSIQRARKIVKLSISIEKK